MPISAANFQRAVMQELRIDVKALLEDRPNWRLHWRSDGIWRFNFCSNTYINIRIQFDSSGVLSGSLPRLTQSNSHEIWLGHLGCSNVFEVAAARLVGRIESCVFPFLNPSLDSFRLARMVLLKSKRLVDSWQPHGNDEMEWGDSVIEHAREQLVNREDLRADRWLLLLATATNLSNQRMMANWTDVDQNCLQRAIHSVNRQRWFKNRYEELVLNSDRGPLGKWESVVEQEHTGWFINHADLQTLLLADQLI